MTKLFAVVTLLSLLAAAYGQADTANPDMTVKSQGTGNADVPLTTARITVRIEQLEENAALAQSNVTSRANSIIEFLLTSGVNQTDIRTESISVSPDYDFVNGTQVLRGYRATYTFSFDVEVGRAGTFIDKVVSMGGLIDSIQFLGSPEDIAEAQNNALTAATMDAKSKAISVLSALGLCPDGVKSIEIGYVQAPQTTNTSDFKLMAAVATPVLPGTGTVTANVNIEWMFMECASGIDGTTNNMADMTNTTTTTTTPQ